MQRMQPRDVLCAPDMYSKSDGYLNALNLLAKFRNYDGGVSQSGDEDMAHLRRALAFYYNQCVQRRVDDGIASWATILNKPVSSLFSSDALGSDNVNVDTMPLSLESYKNDEWITCASASDAFQQLMVPGSPFAEKLDQSLPASNIVSSKGAVESAVQDVLKSSTLSPQNLMIAAFIRTSIMCAKDGMNSENCITVTQAQQQRNQQWAAEQTLFKQVARPLMSFIEMFVVAATPLMAFLVATGIGAKLAVRYFQLIGWIALWPVTMTLCNIYIYNMASREILARTAGGGGPDFLSIGALESVFTTSSDWVATDGLLAASVPMLTFFLVTGSAQAFQSLAGRLQGGDHINEKIASPDLVSPAAVSQGQARFLANPHTGNLNIAGASMPEINWGAGSERSLTSARQNAMTANDAVSRGISKTRASTDAYNRMYSYAANHSSGFASSLDETRDSVLNNLEGFEGSDKFGANWESAIQNAFKEASAVQMAAGGDISVFSAAFRKSFDNELAKTGLVKSDEALAFATRAGETLTKSEGLISKTGSFMRDEVAKNRNISATFGLNETDAEQLKKDASIANSASDTFSAALKTTDSLSGQQKTTADQISGYLNDSPAASQMLSHWVSQNRELTDSIYNSPRMNAVRGFSNGRLVAGLFAMAESSKTKDLNALEQIMGAFGFSRNKNGAPETPNNLKSPEDTVPGNDFENLRKQLQGTQQKLGNGFKNFGSDLEGVVAATGGPINLPGASSNQYPEAPSNVGQPSRRNQTETPSSPGNNRGDPSTHIPGLPPNHASNFDKNNSAIDNHRKEMSQRFNDDKAAKMLEYRKKVNDLFAAESKKVEQRHEDASVLKEAGGWVLDNAGTIAALAVGGFALTGAKGAMAAKSVGTLAKSQIIQKAMTSVAGRGAIQGIFGKGFTQALQAAISGGRQMSFAFAAGGSALAGGSLISLAGAAAAVVSTGVAAYSVGTFMSDTFEEDNKGVSIGSEIFDLLNPKDAKYDANNDKLYNR